MQHKTNELPVGVSFLICTYNSASRISKTLDCLARQTEVDDVSWEVIFVDNASTDGTAELARKRWDELDVAAPLIMMQQPRPGKQYALDIAIEQVQYRYTCIVDDDNRLASDYLRIGLTILEGNIQIGVLGGVSTATFEGLEPAWFKAFQHCYAVGPQLDRAAGGYTPLVDGNVGRNVLWGAGMFVCTALWRQLYGLGFQSLFSGRQGEANLTAGEDDELCYAAQLLGYEIWYSSMLHLQHHMAAGRLTEDYRDRLFYASGRSTIRLNAYRNALWGRQSAAGTNLVKDIAYNVLDFVKKKFSQDAGPNNSTAKLIVRMSQRNTLAQIKDALIHFGQVKAYYEKVLKLKRQLHPSTLPSQPTE